MIHIDKYLFQAGLKKIRLQEMSAQASDVLTPEDGLEVVKKSKIKGLLDPNESWSLIKIEYLEGPHGEPEYDTCENCKKNIRYVCHLMGNDDQKIVGPDCALTLLPPGSSDAKSVETYVGKRISRNKFVKNAIKLFETNLEPSAQEIESFNRLKKLYDQGLWKNKKLASWVSDAEPSILNNKKTAKAIVSTLFESKPVGSLFQNEADMIKNDSTNLASYAVKKWIKEILSDKLSELSKAFELAFDSDQDLRNKKYFFDAKSDFVSSFLDDHKDLLKTDGKSIWT